MIVDLSNGSMGELEATNALVLDIENEYYERGINRKEIRNYEVSLWTLQDEFITVLKWADVEQKNRIQNPEMTLSIDGTEKFTFEIPMYMHWHSLDTDEIITDDSRAARENENWYNQILNELKISSDDTTNIGGNLMTSMRKIKVIFNKTPGTAQQKKDAGERIFEFVVTKVTETHENEQLTCQVECEGLAFHELGKIGYNITLNNETHYEDWLKWDELGRVIAEPLQTLDYWCTSAGLEYAPTLATDRKYNKWYYMVQTKWDSHLDFMADENLTRTEGKVYEEPYAVEWDPETLQPILSVGAKEKERVIDVKESNLYNITQDIAEKFGVYCRYEYGHDENYHITYKLIIFYNNFFGDEIPVHIQYPYNSNSIVRSMDSSNITTKLYITPVDDETTALGTTNIMDSEANKTKENYIMNFDYFKDIGTITQEQYDEILPYEKKILEINNELIPIQNQYNAITERISGGLRPKVTEYKNMYDVDTQQSKIYQARINAITSSDGSNDGTVTRDNNNPDTILLSTQANGMKTGPIGTTDIGIVADSVELYEEYSATKYELTNKINKKRYAFTYDKYGFVTDIRNLRNFTGTQVYATYRFEPVRYYQAVCDFWTRKGNTDRARLNYYRQLLCDYVPYSGQEEGETTLHRHYVFIEKEFTNNKLYHVYKDNMSTSKDIKGDSPIRARAEAYKYAFALVSKITGHENDPLDTDEHAQDYINAVIGITDDNSERIITRGLYSYQIMLVDQIDALLKDKQDTITAFERLMGPALREGYWQPEDYKDYGERKTATKEINFQYEPDVLLTDVKKGVEFGWDYRLFDEEQKLYYESGVDLKKIYYPCIDMRNFPVEERSNIMSYSFIFNTNYYDNRDEDSALDEFTKFTRHFKIGSEAQLVFLHQRHRQDDESNGKTTNEEILGAHKEIIPVLVLTGTQTMTTEEILFMLSSQPKKGHPRFGIVTSGDDENFVISNVIPLKGYAHAENSEAGTHNYTAETHTLLGKMTSKFPIYWDSNFLPADNEYLPSTLYVGADGKRRWRRDNTNQYYYYDEDGWSWSDAAISGNADVTTGHPVYYIEANDETSNNQHGVLDADWIPNYTEAANILVTISDSGSSSVSGAQRHKNNTRKGKDGEVQTTDLTIQSKKYTAVDRNNNILNGWILHNENWYYSGPVTENNQTHYYLARGIYEINGEKFVFDDECVRGSGWTLVHRSDGTPAYYYASEGGRLWSPGASGVYNIDGTDFYMQAEQIDGNTYYYRVSGAWIDNKYYDWYGILQTGWITPPEIINEQSPTPSGGSDASQNSESNKETETTYYCYTNEHEKNAMDLGQKVVGKWYIENKKTNKYLDDSTGVLVKNTDKEFVSNFCTGTFTKAGVLEKMTFCPDKSSTKGSWSTKTITLKDGHDTKYKGRRFKIMSTDTFVNEAGWLKNNGKLYYMEGKTAKDNTNYYFAHTGRLDKDGRTYYMRSDTGAMVFGWITMTVKRQVPKEDGEGTEEKDVQIQYYALPTGELATGWQFIDGNEYKFRGALETNPFELITTEENNSGEQQGNTPSTPEIDYRYNIYIDDNNDFGKEKNLFRAVYPRFKFSSLKLKHDNTLKFLLNDRTLTEYNDYSVLQRSTVYKEGAASAQPYVDTDDPADTTTWQVEYNEFDLNNLLKPQYLEYFITIKPIILFQYMTNTDTTTFPPIAKTQTMTINYTISNASNEVYLDGLEVAKENAYPKVEYEVQISLFGEQRSRYLYNMLAQILMIDDAQLKLQNTFGYISEMVLKLDKPWEDSITVKNYRTKFEDLFSNIVAQTEVVRRASADLAALADGSYTLGTQGIQALLENTTWDTSGNGYNIIDAYIDSHFDSYQVVIDNLTNIFDEAASILGDAQSGINSLHALSLENAGILGGFVENVAARLAPRVYTNERPTEFKPGDVLITTDSSGKVTGKYVATMSSANSSNLNNEFGGFTRTYDGTLAAIQGASLDIDAVEGNISILAQNRIEMQSGGDIYIAANESVNIVGNKAVNIGGTAINMAALGGEDSGGIFMVATTDLTEEEAGVLSWILEVLSNYPSDGPEFNKFIEPYIQTETSGNSSIDYLVVNGNRLRLPTGESRYEQINAVLANSSSVEIRPKKIEMTSADILMNGANQILLKTSLDTINTTSAVKIDSQNGIWIGTGASKGIRMYAHSNNSDKFTNAQIGESINFTTIYGTSFEVTGSHLLFGVTGVNDQGTINTASAIRMTKDDIIIANGTVAENGMNWVQNDTAKYINSESGLSGARFAGDSIGFATGSGANFTALLMNAENGLTIGHGYINVNDSISNLRTAAANTVNSGSYVRIAATGVEIGSTSDLYINTDNFKLQTHSRASADYPNNEYIDGNTIMAIGKGLNVITGRESISDLRSIDNDSTNYPNTDLRLVLNQNGLYLKGAVYATEGSFTGDVTANSFITNCNSGTGMQFKATSDTFGFYNASTPEVTFNTNGMTVANGYAMTVNGTLNISASNLVIGGNNFNTTMSSTLAPYATQSWVTGQNYSTLTIDQVNGQIWAEVGNDDGTHNGMIITKDHIALAGDGRFIVDMTNFKVNASGAVTVTGGITASSLNITGTANLGSALNVGGNSETIDPASAGDDMQDQISPDTIQGVINVLNNGNLRIYGNNLASRLNANSAWSIWGTCAKLYLYCAPELRSGTTNKYNFHFKLRCAFYRRGKVRKRITIAEWIDTTNNYEYLEMYNADDVNGFSASDRISHLISSDDKGD